MYVCMIMINKDKPCCHNVHLIENKEGMTVCANCGFVESNKSYNQQEKRAYNSQEINDRRTKERKWQ